MDRNIEKPPPSRPAYFWWLLANALSLCFAVISWAVCLHVFGNPDLPRNYEILSKIGRLPVLNRFTKLDVPIGNALAPDALYRRYFAYDDEVLSRTNSLLLRNYLSNFERSVLLTYVEGDYQITESRKLRKGDFIDSGLAIKAQALMKPDEFTKPMPYPVFIEYLIPSKEVRSLTSFEPGDVLTIKKSPNSAALIHISKTLSDDDPALYLTVIPIASGPFKVGNSELIQIEPPLKLNPGAGLPVIK